MKVIDRLAVIRHKSKIKKDWKHDDLFRILRKNDIWIIAYKNIRNDNRTLTTVIKKEIQDKISIKRLFKLKYNVLNETYKFKSTNEIKTLNSARKSLLSSTMNNKIVQEVIRMILEAIYEPCFSKQSFAFRQGLGAHDALEYVESKFGWIDWVIDRDPKTQYPIIDRTQLFTILSKKIRDVRFMNLMSKLLKPEILWQSQFTKSSFGVTQGNSVFSILANIYFNELDNWVKNKTNMLYQPYINERSNKYKKFSYQISKNVKQIKSLEKNSTKYKLILKELKILKAERAKVPSLIRSQIQIEYVRYAHDWIIGIKGNSTLAKRLRREVSCFMTINLKQILYFPKTKMINLLSGKVKFLGYEIYLSRNHTISLSNRSDIDLIYRTNPRLRFDVLTDYILQIMEEKGYIKKLIKGYRSISKVNYTPRKNIIIVKHFAQIWKEFSDYYSGCTNLSKLQYIHSLLHLSCAMTLSHRHRSSTKKVFAKYGKVLNVFNKNSNASFPYEKKWSLKKRKWQNKKKFTDPF